MEPQKEEREWGKELFERIMIVSFPKLVKYINHIRQTHIETHTHTHTEEERERERYHIKTIEKQLQRENFEGMGRKKTYYIQKKKVKNYSKLHVRNHESQKAMEVLKGNKEKKKKNPVNLRSCTQLKYLSKLKEKYFSRKAKTDKFLLADK